MSDFNVGDYDQYFLFKGSREDNYAVIAGPHFG
jgi:hypothetical protein